MSTAEDLQVANYGVGGHYEPHFDYARVSKGCDGGWHVTSPLSEFKLLLQFYISLIWILYYNNIFLNQKFY